jgi:hypothetical protein
VRNVFLALLFANLAYCAWSNWVAAPPPPPVNEAITRLPRLKLVDDPPQKAPNATTQAGVSGSPACLSVGPFADADNSARAVALLRAKGFDPRQRTDSGGTPESYWVYVGMKTEAGANRILRDLKRNGFADAAIATDTGEAGHPVSLGLFSERSRAELRAGAARALGFNAVVGERKLPDKTYWVDLSVPQGTTTVPLQDLFAPGVSSGISVQPCRAAGSAAVALPNTKPLSSSQGAAAPKLR